MQVKVAPPIIGMRPPEDWPRIRAALGPKMLAALALPEVVNDHPSRHGDLVLLHFSNCITMNVPTTLTNQGM